MKYANGFTLVEMLSAVLVLSILGALAIPSLRASLSNAHIRGTGEELRSGLDLARSEAIRRNGLVTFSLNGSGWSVSVPGASNDGSDLIVVSRAPKQTTISIAADVPQIQFAGSGWTSPFGSAMNISIGDKSVGECRPAGAVNCLNVVAGAGGFVRTCDPAATAGSATACN